MKMYVAGTILLLAVTTVFGVPSLYATSLQDALNSSTSGLVVLPTSYSQAGPLKIPDDVTLECNSWAVTLSFTGTSTSSLRAMLVVGNNSIVRNCKLDFTASTAVDSILASGTNAELEHNWVLGSAIDRVPNFQVFLTGNRSKSIRCRYDTMQALVLEGSNVQSDDDVFVSYRTGVNVTGSQNAKVITPHCESIGNPTGPIIPGYDCVLIDTSQNVEVIGAQVNASREHGIYVSDANTNVNIDGGTFSSQPGCGVKIHASSTDPTKLNIGITVKHPQITGGSVSPLGSNNPLTSCGMQIDHARQVIVTSPVIRLQNIGIDVEGLVDGLTISSPVVEFNTGPGIRFRDTRGPLNRIRVISAEINGNSFGNAANGFSGIEIRPDGGGKSNSNRNSDIVISDGRFGDNQSTPTQHYGFALIAPTNGSTISNVKLLDNTRVGKIVRLYSSTTGYKNLVIR